MLFCSVPGHAGEEREIHFAEALFRVEGIRYRTSAERLVEAVFYLYAWSGEELPSKLREIEVNIEENGYRPAWLVRKQGLYLIGFDKEERHKEEMLVKVYNPEAVLQMIPEEKRAAPGTVIKDDSRVIPEEDILRQVEEYEEDEARRRGCTIRWTGRPGELIGGIINGRGCCWKAFTLFVDDSEAALQQITGGRAAYAAESQANAQAEMDKAREAGKTLVAALPVRPADPADQEVPARARLKALEEVAAEEVGIARRQAAPQEAAEAASAPPAPDQAE